jgi:hypothetical protein
VGRKRNVDEWREILRAWETSGLSRAEFCRTQILPVSTFDYWRKKQRGTVETNLPFVKVPKMAAGVDRSMNIRIVINDRVSVELCHGFTGEDLSTVLLSIGSASCS